MCLYCTHEVESAEHILLHYSRFAAEKDQLESLTGAPLSPRGLIAAMVAEKGAWERAHGIIVKIMKRARTDEMANRNVA